jgi:hypothetical protein
MTRRFHATWTQAETAAQAIAWTVRLCCVARVIAIVELGVERKEMQPGGVLNWQISGLVGYEHRRGFRFRVQALLARVPQRLFFKLLALDAFVVSALFVWPTNPFLLLAAALLLLMEMTRHYLSYDGADELTLVCLTALAVGGILRAQEIAVLFIGCEVCLAYLVAGVYKASSPYWKKGRALLLVTRTQLFGQQRLAQILNENRKLTSVFEALFVLWETVFPVVLFARPELMLAMLGVGLIFHFACAWVMGLNTFLWAFGATYPCIVFTNQRIRTWLGGNACDTITWVAAAGLTALVGILTVVIPRKRPLKQDYGLEAS